jgi:acyl dehydratase
VPIDPEAALSAPERIEELAWTERDVLLYHLSLGAGRGADPELHLTYEDRLRVLPTFAMVAGQGISAGRRVTTGFALPGLDIELARLLHAGQHLVVHRPITPHGRATRRTRLVQVWDKGRSAVLVFESTVTSETGDPLWTSGMQVWARGEGGFGGEPGPAAVGNRPGRDPDVVLDVGTTPDQARLYRLNGDLNPMHVDPEFAARAGFEGPILHGLATYGIVGKAVVDRLLDGDPARLVGYDVRFAGTLFPGETLRVELWEGERELVMLASSPERDDAPVLSQGRLVTTR